MCIAHDEHGECHSLYKAGGVDQRANTKVRSKGYYVGTGRDLSTGDQPVAPTNYLYECTFI